MIEFLEKLKNNQSQKPIRIVFVCTANCGRSPVAEILFEKLLIDELGSINKLREKNIIVESAGTIYSGFTIARKSAKLLITEENIDMSRCLEHRGRRLDEIEEPDLLLTMTASHISQVIALMPGWKHKVFTLDEFVQKELGKDGRDIDDPAGRSEFDYRIIKNQIKKCLYLLLAEFKDAGLV